MASLPLSACGVACVPARRHQTRGAFPSTSRPQPCMRTQPRLLAWNPVASSPFRWASPGRRRRPAAQGLGQAAPEPAPSSSGSGGDDPDAPRIDLQLPRRSRLVTFTCNKCGTTTERLVNPVAWDRGMVIAQCSGCQAWHKLADAANLVEEIVFDSEGNSDDE